MPCAGVWELTPGRNAPQECTCEAKSKDYCSTVHTWVFPDEELPHLPDEKNGYGKGQPCDPVEQVEWTRREDLVQERDVDEGRGNRCLEDQGEVEHPVAHPLRKDRDEEQYTVWHEKQVTGFWKEQYSLAHPQKENRKEEQDTVPNPLKEDREEEQYTVLNSLKEGREEESTQLLIP